MAQKQNKQDVLFSWQCYHWEMSSIIVEVEKEDRGQKETLKEDRIDLVKQDQVKILVYFILKFKAS